MEKNPLDVLNDWGKTGKDGEPAPEPAAAPAPAGSPTDNATKQRAQEVAEGFRKHREKQKRRTSGQPNPPQNRPPEPREDSAEPDQTHAEARPSGNSGTLAEEEAREKRRKRTNWNLRKNALTTPDPEATGPVKNRPRVEDEPMSLEIDRSKIVPSLTREQSRSIPSSISNEELQKAGWSADRFAGHEKKTEEAMAKRGEKFEKNRRGKILAALDALVRDAAAETEKKVEPTARQEENFARAVDHAVREVTERDPDSRSKKHDAGEAPARADRGQVASKVSGGNPPEEIFEKNQSVGPRATETVWPRQGNSASRLAGLRLMRKGVPGDKIAGMIPAERRRAAASKKTEPKASARAAILGDVPDGIPAAEKVPSPSPENAEEARTREDEARRNRYALETTQDLSLNVSSQKIREQRNQVAAEIRAARRAFRGENDAAYIEVEGREKRAARLKEGSEAAQKLADQSKQLASEKDASPYFAEAADRLGEGARALEQEAINEAGFAATGRQDIAAARAESNRQIRAEYSGPAKERRSSEEVSAALAAQSGGAAGDGFEDFYAALPKVTLGISGGEYTPETIRETAEALRRGEPGISLADLPRTFGIREAVGHLLSREARERQLDDLRREFGGEDPAKQAYGEKAAEAIEAARAAAAEAIAEADTFPDLFRAIRGAGSSLTGDSPEIIVAWIENALSGHPGYLPETLGIRRAVYRLAPQLAPLDGTVTKSAEDLVHLPVASFEDEPATDAPDKPEVARPAPSPESLVERPTSAPDHPSRSWRKVIGGGLLVGGKVIGAPFSWAWRRTFAEPSFPGKDNPFKKERGPLYPFFWGFSLLWQTIGGIFGAKFEKKKEEKAK